MFSIIMPCELNRIDLLNNTINEYNKRHIPDGVELLIVTREEDTKLFYASIINTKMNIRIIPYVWKGEYFNPAMALNIGVKKALYNRVIITCPEVYPLTDVLKQLNEGNVICQVFDENVNGDRVMSLVNSKFRGETPAMYFLALFNKEDIYKINGWDLDFMNGYAWEDTDFGDRFVRAKIPFVVKDDIQASHKWHQRGTMCEGWHLNKIKYHQNSNVIICKRGLKDE